MRFWSSIAIRLFRAEAIRLMDGMEWSGDTPVTVKPLLWYSPGEYLCQLNVSSNLLQCSFLVFELRNCLLCLKKIDPSMTPVQHSFTIVPKDTSIIKLYSSTFHKLLSKMYLSKRSLLAALFLSSASFTAASDVVDSSLELSSTYREKLMLFRNKYVIWKNQHSISYGVDVMEIEKMKTWVDNHGE